MTCCNSSTFSHSSPPSPVVSSLPSHPPSPSACFDFFQPFQFGPLLWSSPRSPSSTGSSSISSDLDQKTLQMPFLQEMPDWGARDVVGPSGMSRKRFTVSDLDDLMEKDDGGGYLWMDSESGASAKRLRSDGWVSAEGCTAVVYAGDFSDWPLEVDAHQKEGANAQELKTETVLYEASNGCWEDSCALRCGDLDDILDVLLQKSEPFTLDPPPTVLSSFNSPRISAHDTNSTQESSNIIVNRASSQLSKCAQLPDNRDISFASTTASPSIQKCAGAIERERTGAVNDRMPQRRSWNWQTPTRDATAAVQTRPIPKASDSQQSLLEEGFSNVNATDLLQMSQLRPLGCKRERVQIWAGPTLLEIESALAHKNSSPSIFSPAAVNTKGNSSSLSFSEGEVTSNEEQRFCDSWRTLLRRGAGEPKYTLRLRCEEEAVSDGYRWRKYGQKTIKSSP